jgi:hypothetical protein
VTAAHAEWRPWRVASGSQGRKISRPRGTEKPSSVFKRPEMDWQQQQGVGGDDMLDVMSADVAYCYERATRCAEQAREVRDKVIIKADLLDLEARWLSLAQLYLFDEWSLPVECSGKANERSTAEYSRRDTRVC